MTRSRKKYFSVFLWHRRLGLLAVLFIIILAITGIMLNHTESLALDEKTIESDWLLDRYGLNPHARPTSYRAGDHVITLWDDELFFDRHSLSTSAGPLRGAVLASGMIAAGLEQQIILLDMKGQIIERMDVLSGSGGIKRMGLRDSRLIIEAGDETMYEADDQLVNWVPSSPGNIRWSQPVNLDKDLEASLLTAYRGNGLTLERIILDLHSGRLLNADWGIYIMDASAIIMLWLGTSGIWVWLSRRRKMKTKKHYRRHHR